MMRPTLKARHCAGGIPALPGSRTTAARYAQNIFGVAGLCLAFLTAGLFLSGVRINTTGSIPPGIYRTLAVPVVRGGYVSVCPPDTPLFHEARRRQYTKSGPCPGGHGFFMKRVAALAGDSVTIGADGVFINGVLSRHSASFTHDGAGRLLPQAHRTHYVLEDSEMLLLSDTTDRSFDSRYFGPLSR